MKIMSVMNSFVPSDTYEFDAVPDGCTRTGVGVIPQDWDAVLLGDLFVFKNGLNKAKKFFGTGTPIVNYMDVLQGPGIRTRDLSGRVRLSPEEVENFDVQSGDVFFTRTSETVDEIGAASVVLDEPYQTVFSGFVLRARSKDGRLDHEFKKYCFGSRQVRSQIVAKASYTTRALTTGRSLSAVWIGIPPKSEQRAIAEVLSDADRLLDSLDALIAKKRAVRIATMQQLLTCRVRLPGFRDTWRSVSLGDAASVRNERVLPQRVEPDTLCIELEHIGQGNGVLRVHATAERAKSLKCRFIRGDVLFGRLRPYLRKYWRADRDGICTTEIWPLTADPRRLDSGFLFALVQQERFLETAAISYGTHMPRAEWSVVRRLEFPLPGLREQQAIALVLSDLDAEITALEECRDKTRALKQGMMQQLLTGRTRLVEPEAAQ